MNILDQKYQTKVLGEELKETLLENKIDKQLSDKNMFRRRSSKFISSEEINQMNKLKDSLKDIGVLSTPDEDHLTIRKLPNITEEEYYQKKNNMLKQENLDNLENYIKNMQFNFKDVSCGKSIGGIAPLTHFVEMLFFSNADKLKEMTEKYDLLKPYINYYRTICGDGNCFYRAVMFRYLEILILTNKIQILEKVTCDIIDSFNSDELKKRRNINNNDIKPKLTFKILFIIIDLLKKEEKVNAHQVLVKCFCTCQKFDYAIILYFRYILYEYIKKNENKIYLKSFPVKIGNLLPNQFENDNGEFLFNEFYEKYLLHFYTDAEKIIIYLTPFVLGIELNVVVCDLNESDILQKFSWEGESEIKTDEVISVINNKSHYQIIYNQKDEDKNKRFFEIYKIDIPPRVLFQKKNDNDDGFRLFESAIEDEKKPKTTIESRNNLLPKNINNNQNYNNNQNNINNQKK
jgi:hypothetical protein